VDKCRETFFLAYTKEITCEKKLGFEESADEAEEKAELWNKKMNKNSDKQFSALGLAWEMGYTIAVPLVALALGGRFLDKKLGTAPWLLLFGILISIAVSSWLVYKKTLDILK